MYLTITRPDIMHVVSLINRYMEYTKQSPHHLLYLQLLNSTLFYFRFYIYFLCVFIDVTSRDPSSRETRGTHFIVTCGACYQPDHCHPDSPKDMHDAVILSGPPPGKASDVSASPIQGRANDAGRA
ncbi:hypothetical protein AAG906_018728 [Vitis piasezkii]